MQRESSRGLTFSVKCRVAATSSARVWKAPAIASISRTKRNGIMRRLLRLEGGTGNRRTHIRTAERTVAQIFNLLYRRISFCGRVEKPVIFGTADVLPTAS